MVLEQELHPSMHAAFLRERPVESGAVIIRHYIITQTARRNILLELK